MFYQRSWLIQKTGQWLGSFCLHSSRPADGSSDTCSTFRCRLFWLCTILQLVGMLLALWSLSSHRNFNSRSGYGIFAEDLQLKAWSSRSATSGLQFQSSTCSLCLYSASGMSTISSTTRSGKSSLSLFCCHSTAALATTTTTTTPQTNTHTRTVMTILIIIIQINETQKVIWWYE